MSRNGYGGYVDIIEQSKIDEQNRVERALEVARQFNQAASQNGGKLDLHIDRYGDIKMTVVINANRT